MNKDTAPTRALLIEDVEDDAILLKDMFESEDFNFEWHRVYDEQGLIAALNSEWHIVFSDYTMPDFDGFRALELVRRHDPDVPFIFISGTIGEDAAVQAMRHGAQDYIIKGAYKRLLPAVERELREVRLRRENRLNEQMLRKLSMAVRQSAESVIITDPDGIIEYVNPAFEQLTGYQSAEVIGLTPAILKSGKYDGTGRIRELWQTVKQGNVYHGVLINRRKDGALYHEDLNITPLKDERGQITHFVFTGRNITDRVLADEERSRLVAILEATPDTVAIFEPEGKLHYLNDTGCRLLGLDSDEDPGGRNIQDLFPENGVQQLKTEILPAVFSDGIWNGETHLQLRTNNERFPISLVVLGHQDISGNTEYISMIARDISEFKRFEAELHYQATHDGLTGLPNRFLLTDRLNMALIRARRNNNYVAVLFIDLNNFKRINDSLGHAAGDVLLREVAARIQSCLRLSETVARHGGDEFTIVAGELPDVDSAQVIVRKVRNALQKPVQVESHELFVSFSCGIAIYPYDGVEVDILLKNADTAMYQAKTGGANQYCYYAPDMNERSHDLLSLETDLRHALENNEYLLHYQPQIDLRSGRINGMEGLIRWQHGSRGTVSPGEFIPLLENSGLIISVGEWVLRQGCMFLRKLRERGFENMSIAINVSAVQFNDEELQDKIKRAIAEENIPPQSLKLEITENILIRSPERAAEILQNLHALGIRLAIDDFGTGYSSMAYLKRLPLDELKIDKTFVDDIGTEPGNAIVEASVTLGQKLGLTVVAEGVETLQQLRFLQLCNCDSVQGYYLSKPVKESKLVKILDKRWDLASYTI